ncbi:Hexosaminidase D like protein [Argiope bruennichi]|uniref:beta-N-acetylhexosaminidase n=1 Tax=Argiope bruennichi TaxID=94029 RepID=A0A8T0FQE1_ARGBR|nr:Hexosaminidase D like protein [Argiope bruennichi]
MSGYDCSSPDFSKLVHFDLKGAPPIVGYYEQVFPLLKKLGATGILMEYEDMFPYQGDLQIVCQPDVYSMEEIQKIQSLAAENGLDVIPLVQSFGHLEFLLKHDKYYEIREAERYPNALCPSHHKSEGIILDIVAQILDCHKNSKYIHIGGDEVWHLGQCNRCKEKMEAQKWKKEHLFLDHVTRIVRRIREINQDIGIIIWDDMMRDIDVSILKASEIGNLILPMVWHYLPADEFKLKNSLWEKYASVFPSIWIASAFKGATEMTQLITPTRYHISNHQAWLRALNTFGNKFNKFDHYTVLCELFPVALPTLAVCLLTLIDGDFTENAHRTASNLLGFERLIEIDTFPRPQPVGPPPLFPGGNIHNSCLQLGNCITEYHILMHHPSIEGAFSSFQIMHNRVNTLHIDQFLPRARILLMNIEAINVQLESELSKIFYPSTVEEFLAVNIHPFLEKLRKLVRDADLQIIFHSAPEEMQSNSS